MNKKKKVIWFIDGAVPTDADNVALDRLSSHKVKVVFRNAQQVGENEAPEACDAVGGCVPKAYEALPRIGEEPPRQPVATEPKRAK